MLWNAVCSPTSVADGSCSGRSSMRRTVPPRVCISLHFSGAPRRSVSASLSASTAASSSSLRRRSSACCDSNAARAVSVAWRAASTRISIASHSSFSRRALSDPSTCFAAVFCLLSSSVRCLVSTFSRASNFACASTTAASAASHAALASCAPATSASRPGGASTFAAPLDGPVLWRPGWTAVSPSAAELEPSEDPLCVVGVPSEAPTCLALSTCEFGSFSVWLATTGGPALLT
mmetsp:Transcript_16716/g.37484  ORF Transcript_16716/g.37484 Transcript_16716/m.37484 type:complete len:234 (-) Transcript_16716:709-1410(-)